MSDQIRAIADRLSTLRDILDLSQQQMAESLNMSLEEYRSYEQGERDFAFSFLYGCANILGVDIVDLLTGETPKLNYFSLVKAGEGLNIDRRKEYKYQHLAFFFRHKNMEPFCVTIDAQDNPDMHLNTHDGQEFNYIISGQMEIQVGEQKALMQAGDAAYYDAKQPHGMRAVGAEPCQFLAVIAK